MVYPELLAYKEEPKSETDLYSISAEYLFMRVKKVLDKWKQVAISPAAKEALTSKYIRIEEDVTNAFRQVALSFLLQRRQADYKDYETVFEKVWGEYLKGVILADLKPKLKQAFAIHELIQFEDGCLKGLTPSLKLSNEHLRGKLFQELRVHYTDMQTMKIADDIRGQAVKSVKKQIDALLGEWYKLNNKIIGEKGIEDNFAQSWSMLVENPTLQPIKRRFSELIAQYYFYIREDYKSRLFDPSVFEIDGVISELNRTRNASGQDIADRFENIRSDVGAISNFLSARSYTPYVHFITGLMNATNADCPASQSLWLRQPVDADQMIYDEFFEILGGEKKLMDAVQEIGPEVRDKAVTAVYDYDDYGRMEGSLTDSPRAFLKQGPMEPSTEGLVAMLIKVLKFKLAWKMAELQNEGLLDEDVFKKAYQVISRINEIEKGELLSGEDIAGSIKGLIDGADQVTSPIIIEIFNPDGSLKGDGLKKLYRYASKVSEGPKKDK